MKKILTTILVTLVALPAFAAFQYDVVSNKKDHSAKGESYQIKITEGTGIIYLGDWHGETSLGDKSVLGFGYYTDPSNLIAGSVVTLDDGTKAYKLGDFSAGDTISIWVQTEDGIGGTTGAWSDLTNRGTFTNALGDVGQLNIDSEYISFTITGVESITPTPSGQPLPGILVTTLMGSALLLLPWRKKLFAKAK